MNSISGKNSTSGNLYILAYHHVEKRVLPTIARVSPKNFCWQLKYLKSQGLYLCTLSNLINTSLRKKSVAITFDDGFHCLYDYVYPHLEMMNFPATIFVVTGYMGKRNTWDVNFGFKSIMHLDWNEVKELAAKGHEIGSHSHHHYDLTQLDEKTLKFELDYSKKFIEDKIGKRVNFISYPFGRFNPKVLQSAEECGYMGGVTLNPFGVISELSFFQLPRLGVYFGDTKINFKLKFKNGFGGQVEKVKLQIINFFSLSTVIVKNFT